MPDAPDIVILVLCSKLSRHNPTDPNVIDSVQNDPLLRKQPKTADQVGHYPGGMAVSMSKVFARPWVGV